LIFPKLKRSIDFLSWTWEVCFAIVDFLIKQLIK